jgi:hypothetical protein
MSRIALVAPIALAVLAFAGCQSDEEKLKERAALKQEIATEIKNDLNYTIQMEVDRQLKQAVEDHKRKIMEEQAKAAAAKAAPVKPAAPKKR